MTCDAVNVTHASKDPDLPTYSYHANVTYSCLSGHEHTNGSLNRTCTAINKWSGTVPVCTSRSIFVRNIFSLILPFVSPRKINKRKLCFYLNSIHAIKALLKYDKCCSERDTSLLFKFDPTNICTMRFS